MRQLPQGGTSYIISTVRIIVGQLAYTNSIFLEWSVEIIPSIIMLIYCTCSPSLNLFEFQTGVVTGVPDAPEIKGHDQIMRLAEACQLARQVLDTVGANVQVS